MIKRLRIKFVCINMAIVTAMLYVIFFLILFFMGLGMQIQSRNMMQNVLDNAFHADWQREERQYSWRPYIMLQAEPGGRIRILDKGNFPETENGELEEYVQIALEEEESSGMIPESNLRFQKRNAAKGILVVLMDTTVESRTMENLAKTCVFIGGLSFLVFLAISFLLASWAVKPVERAWNQQRQFVADASHELKTPLTVIMTNAELLQSPEFAEAERSRFAASILTMSQQMRGLVESLLELARVDNGTAKMAFSRLDFSELVQEGLLPFEPVYFENTLALESDVEENLEVRGSYTHLRQVLDILLDNAAKYSVPGSCIRVRLCRQGSHCLLSVSNPGETISREDLKNIFKRFYRIDKARAMNQSYGLGLSIADSIIREHRGKIWAESENGVNTFWVQLTSL